MYTRYLCMGFDNVINIEGKRAKNNLIIDLQTDQIEDVVCIEMKYWFKPQDYA